MIWSFLILLIIILLAFDLIILNKKGEALTNKRAAIETVFWVLVAFSFSGAVYWIYQAGLVSNSNELTPSGAVVKYITGYLIELSLSVDNLFVIAMIFSSFNIPIKYQHKVLFWGILGATLFRGIMIVFGVALINSISWFTYVFGGFLLLTAFKMLIKEGENPGAPSESKLAKFVQISDSLDGEKFWTLQDGKKIITPLFAALIMIEITDLLFALDSIPAILAVTTDPFLVFSSNIFAVLGLRAMYFFLANMLEKFHYLKYSVFAILIFVSVKLLTIHFIQFPEWFSLTFIALSLLMGVLVSLNQLSSKKE